MKEKNIEDGTMLDRHVLSLPPELKAVTRGNGIVRIEPEDGYAIVKRTVAIDTHIAELQLQNIAKAVEWLLLREAPSATEDDPRSHLDKMWEIIG